MVNRIFLDIDGTLTNSENIIIPEARNLVDALISSNNKIYISTGRSYLEAKEVINELSIEPQGIYLDGNLVFWSSDNYLWSGHYLDDHLRFNELLLNNVLVIETLEFYYCRSVKEKLLFCSTFKVKRENIIVLNEDLFIEIHSIQRIFIYSHNIKEKNIRNIQISGCYYQSIGNWKVINSKAVGKGLGIKYFLHDKVGDNIISIGNDLNDISMFKVSDLSILVNSNNISIKNQVDFSFEHINLESVEKIIEIIQFFEKMK